MEILKNLMKKGFNIPYEDSSVYPTASRAREAITKYCEVNHYDCAFTSDDEVTIDGVRWKIERGIELGSRGNYGIKCREI